MRDPYVPEPRIHSSAVIAPGCHVYGQVEIGRNSLILFGAVIRAELDRIYVGSQTNVQDNVVIHCDEDIPCLIGDRVTIGHSAVVHGSTVGNNALIGIGAKLLNRSSVGEGSLIAAGSVVLEGSTIPPWTLAVGAPAKPLRELTAEEIERTADGVDHYLQLADTYREIFAKSK